MLTIGAQRVIIADPTVVRLYALIERLAPVNIPVLITGETGCGKELVATALHTRSPRAGKTLISLNCAALHEMLVESELFGHERGAFSGASATKPGLIEAASGSTLFLDEIGELALGIQAKLLRVLESRRVTRVGDVHEREVDIRIVAATNRDLESDVVAGRFRRDLFFRLSAATLELPPLRQRSSELPLLADAFLEEACRLSGRSVMRISDEALAVLLAHSWPGNIRELKNLMQYVAAALPVEILLAEHVSERLGRMRAPTAPWIETSAPSATRFRPIADELRELEITRIREALEATGGNQTRAAGLLTMPVRTFFEKAKQYGTDPQEKGPPPMSDQHPPFVIKRPDGFVGVELSVSSQLTLAEARELAVQLLIAARAAEDDDYRDRSEACGWIVWERATDGGRPYIRAIDLSEQKANKHVEYLKAEAQMQRPPKTEPDLLIEETRLDHLYAAALIEALRKRSTKQDRHG